MVHGHSKLISIRMCLILIQIMCASFLIKNIQLIMNPPSIDAKWLAGISFVLFLFLFIVNLISILKVGKMKNQNQLSKREGLAW